MLVGYARVSTADQNLDLQTDALKKAGCERIFEEHKSGKAGTHRPELLAALSYLRPDDTLVVWKLDRLGRSLTEMMKTLDELSRKKIHFKSLTEQLDSQTANGRFALQVQGAMAEYFLDLNRERTIEGMKAAVARGRKGGRPKRLTAEDVDVVRALIGAGNLSMSQIAKRLNVHVSTLYSYLPGGRAGFEPKVIAPEKLAEVGQQLEFKRRTGPRENTREKDAGLSFHAVPVNSQEAVCGVKPRRGGTWGAWTMKKPTCPKCIDILASG